MTLEQEALFDEPSGQSPIDEGEFTWNRDLAKRALDELFSLARNYNSSAEYVSLLQFVARFRFYSLFNAVLIHSQMPGARFAAPPSRWLREYRRSIRPGARPIVILQPKGPVMFVFDVSDTLPENGAPPLPPAVEAPFEVRDGVIGDELRQTIGNAARDGVNVIERDAGSQSAGAIQSVRPSRSIRFAVGPLSKGEFIQVPVRYQVLLNLKHSETAKYATLVHELAHLYCGHLGTPNETWWPDRRRVDFNARELEAESVCYLVCARLGIDNPSDEYLASFLREQDQTPPISLDCVIRSATILEQMGRERLKAREHATTTRSTVRRSNRRGN